MYAQTPFDVELRAKIAVVTLRSKLKQPLPSAAGFNLVKHCPILIISGRYIPGAGWLKMELSVSTSPHLCFYITGLNFSGRTALWHFVGPRRAISLN